MRNFTVRCSRSFGSTFRFRCFWLGLRRLVRLYQQLQFVFASRESAPIRPTLTVSMERRVDYPNIGTRKSHPINDSILTQCTFANKQMEQPLHIPTIEILTGCVSFKCCMSTLHNLRCTTTAE